MKSQVSENMKKYNEKERCVKCGNEANIPTYKKFVVFDGGFLIRKEFLEVTCGACCYQWIALPLDRENKEISE